jgi:electron transfer flavoprotein alpha subunit
MSVLIIAEHDNKNLNPNLRNLAEVANKIGGGADCLILGNENIETISLQAQKVSGITKILVAKNTKFSNVLAEDAVNIIKDLSANYSHIIFPSTTFGKDVAPRLSASLDIQQISDVMEVIDDKTFKRPIYAGNAIATVKSKEAKNILTIRVSSFDKAELNGNAAIENLNINIAENNISKFVSIQKTESARPELTSAKIVVSGGRGVGSSENFKIIEKLADKLGAAVGASRAAVDAGYVPNDYQVGQTGKIVAPDLYIAAGISGAIQHLAGMKDSKVIVAINKDENAPIFEVADIGIVGDLFKIVPELEGKL